MSFSHTKFDFVSPIFFRKLSKNNITNKKVNFTTIACKHLENTWFIIIFYFSSNGCFIISINLSDLSSNKKISYNTYNIEENIVNTFVSVLKNLNYSYFIKNLLLFVKF